MKVRNTKRFSLSEAIQVATKLTTQESNLNSFVKELLYARKRGKRIFVAGNGGSANTSLHLTSDLMNLGFDVVCLNSNISRVTAITNDYGWEFVYTKQMEHFKSGDIFIPISVHGGGKVGESWSGNLLLASIEAIKHGGKVLSLIGCDGGRLKEYSTHSIIVPDNSCCYVEGFHSLICHILCEKIERKIRK